MKVLARFVLSAILGFMLIGCGAAAKKIAMKAQSERTDVFKVVSSEEAISAGYADVIIRANIKTHLAGFYIAESRRSAHGKEFYPFLINIKGQAFVWQIKGDKHVLPKYIDGKTSQDPEAGEGMKYVLEKRIRLAAGNHAVFFGLPGEPYYTVRNISVKDGGLYVLEFMPIYKYKTFPTRIPSFLKGISHYKIQLNGMNDQE